MIEHSYQFLDRSREKFFFFFFLKSELDEWTLSSFQKKKKHQKLWKELGGERKQRTGFSFHTIFFFLIFSFNTQFMHAYALHVLFVITMKKKITNQCIHSVHSIVHCVCANSCLNEHAINFRCFFHKRKQVIIWIKSTSWTRRYDQFFFLFYF